jgi:putative photosynthetic complex assembly protein 2
LGSFAAPVLYALFVWWFSTGLILFLDGLPRRTFPRTMGVATALLVAGLATLYAVRGDGSAFGAYAAFTAALAVWGWNEIAFLTGWLTGPRRSECAPNLRGFARFVQAARMILWHEFAIAAGFLLVLAVGWGGENAVGRNVYLVLWAMRLSAKLNIFLGVPNPPLAFLPERLRYLASGFRTRAMNALFPISITASTAVCALLGAWTYHATSEGAAIGHALVATLMALAVLEHWFLVLPLPSERLWAWGFQPSHQGPTPTAAPERAVVAGAVANYPDVKSKGSAS